MLRDICPKSMVVKKQYYLDSIGLLAAYAARFVKLGNPTLRQILFWDRFIVPASILFFLEGKTIISVYEKE
jgi:hypothetical protein